MRGGRTFHRKNTRPPRRGWYDYPIKPNERTAKGAHTLARPNYGFEKRQKELAKQKKKEEKRLKKLARSSASGDEPPEADEAAEGVEAGTDTAGGDPGEEAEEGSA